MHDRLAVQVVVTVVQFHHPRARALQADVTRRLDLLGRRDEWRQVINAFDVFARELNSHMAQEEAQILDHVQFLMVRKKLQPGALLDVRDVFDALMKEHDTMCVLRHRLDFELTRTPSLDVGLRALLREFVVAFTDHHDFEQDALIPVLAPFLSIPEATVGV